MPTESNETELEPAEAGPIVKHADVQPIDMQELFRSAIAQGTDGAAALTQLVELKHKMDDRAAAMAFARAMSAFQAECPPIPKLTKATVVHRSGGQHTYNYAKLDAIALAIAPCREKHGLSHSWRTEENKAGKLTTICIVRHRDGHKEETPVPCPVDATAKITEPQKARSAETSSKRSSLVAAYGLTTCDPDDDGAGGPGEFEPISEAQAKKLHSFMLDVGANFERFYAFFDIKDYTELPVARYEEAMRELEKKREKQT